MTTFRTMPCKPNACRGYRYGWLMAIGDRWKLAKEIRGEFRHVTHWFIKHHKQLRPNPNAKRDAARWKRMGYGD